MQSNGAGPKASHGKFLNDLFWTFSL